MRRVCAWLVGGVELPVPELAVEGWVLWTIPVPLTIWPIVPWGALPAVVELAPVVLGLLVVAPDVVLFDEVELEPADLLLAMTMAAVRRLELVEAPFWPGGAPPGSGMGAPGLLGSGVDTPGWFGPSQA